MADSYFLGSEVELKHVGGTLYEATGAAALYGNDIKSSDFVKDWFAEDTDYDLNPDGTGQATVYFNHGKDEFIGKAKLGHKKAELTKDQRALWIKHHLDIAEVYDAMVVELIQKRKAIGKNFGWSIGPPQHLVERQVQADGSYKMIKFPVAEVSITLIPADWRQTLIPAAELKPTNAKSLLDMVSGSADKTDEHSEAQTAEGTGVSPSANDQKMNPITDKNTQNKTTEVIVSDNPTQENADETKMNDRFNSLETKMAKTDETLQEILKAMQNAPRQVVGGYYSVDGGSADKNIKSLGDLALAVANKDLKRLATVYNAIPSEEFLEGKTQNTLEAAAGGVMVRPQVLMDLGFNLSLVSPLDNLINKIPVDSPSGSAPMPSYKIVPSADGQSASAGGVKTAKRKEGAVYVDTELSLEELLWNVSDFASGELKATKLQMKAAPMIEALLKDAIREAVANKKEWCVFQGSGNGEPLGILNWAGVITVTEDTDNTFVAADLDEMVSRHFVSDPSKTAWFYSYGAYTQIGPLARPNVAVSGNRGETPMTVLDGKPHYKSQHLPAIGTDGYVVLGDFSKYIMFEYDGLYIDFSEHIYKNVGKVAWFFGQWLDGKPIMPTSITLEDGATTVSPFVIIKNKT